MSKQASKAASRPAAVKRLLRRTTIAVPEELLVLADQAVREGRARSRAELLAQALRREFAAQRRATVDAAFARMGEGRIGMPLSALVAEGKIRPPRSAGPLPRPLTLRSRMTSEQAIGVLRGE